MTKQEIVNKGCGRGVVNKVVPFDTIHLLGNLPNHKCCTYILQTWTKLNLAHVVELNANNDVLTKEIFQLKNLEW